MRLEGAGGGGALPRFGGGGALPRFGGGGALPRFGGGGGAAAEIVAGTIELGNSGRKF